MHGKDVGISRPGILPCRGEADASWFGQLLLLFSYTDKHDQEHEAVYVRWLQEAKIESAAQEAVRTTRLKWDTVGIGRHAKPRYDVVAVDRVEKLVCLQADSTAPGHYYNNRFVTYDKIWFIALPSMSLHSAVLHVF
jgi:hypothetical protein